LEWPQSPASTAKSAAIATSISARRDNNGARTAQTMAAHESPRTSKLNVRTGNEIALDEVDCDLGFNRGVVSTHRLRVLVNFKGAQMKPCIQVWRSVVDVAVPSVED
jgi:hypothetical protein